jgi:hypothetical protein
MDYIPPLRYSMVCLTPIFFVIIYFFGEKKMFPMICVFWFSVQKIVSETFLHSGIIKRDSIVYTYVLRPSYKQLDI